ncbi:MAG: XTP/dITP diphosphatase [Bacillota bacterium]
MIEKIVLATQNKGKVKEFTEMLEANDLNVQVISLLEIEDVPEIVEDGSSFKENAYIKAHKICLHTGLLTLADDSGLEVDYLNGAPGIHSARFAGEPKNDQKNNEKLLRLLEGVPSDGRTARFKCAICVMFPGGDFYETEGVCEGVIASSPKGSNGFGFDPLFYLPQYGLTMAQLSSEEKNKISHRAKAFAKAIEILQKLVKKT